MHRNYTVTGRWPFPLTMLRRDNAHAATADDQRLIDRMSQEASDPEFRTSTRVEINLIMDSGEKLRSAPYGRYRPCAERWESFGWKVIADPELVILSPEVVAADDEARAHELVQSALAKLTPEERRALRNAYLNAIVHP